MALEREREFYLQHFQEWLTENRGRFALIKEESLVGLFSSYDEALSEGARRFGAESFLVRPVLENQPEASIPALSLGLINAHISHAD